MSLNSTRPRIVHLSHPAPTSLSPFPGGASVNIKQAADQAVTASTTVASTDLTYNLQASAIYEFEAWVPFALAGTASGYKFTVAAPASPVNLVYEMRVLNGSTPGVTAESVKTAVGTVNGALAAAANHLLFVRGSIETDAGGALTIQFAQNTSDAGAITVKRGAFLKITRIS